MLHSRKVLKAAALAIGALAIGATGALAGGEVVYGGVRQAGAAVPVPVPAPVPDVGTGWYARIDAAYGMGNVSKYRSTDPYVDQFRGDSYMDNFPRYGLGFGYYFNKWLRADITVDQRNDIESRGVGIRNYTIANTAGGAGTNPTIAMRDTYSDGFLSSNSTGLANIYADLPMTERFTPYIGGGLGFVRHQVKGRAFSRTTECVDTVDCDPAVVGAQGPTAATIATTTAGGINYQLAAALMAGFSYRVWDNTKIDLGYRWLWLQGASWQGRSLTTIETLKLPDQSIHELRVGLRYDIN